MVTGKRTFAPWMKRTLAVGALLLVAATPDDSPVADAAQRGEAEEIRSLLRQGAEAVWGGALADLCEDAVAFDPTFEAIRPMAILLDKHDLGARYPTTIPGGVPAEAYDATDSERALEIAGDVLAFVEGRPGETT